MISNIFLINKTFLLSSCRPMGIPPLLWHSLPLWRVRVKEVMSPFCVYLGCWVLLPRFQVHAKSHKLLLPLHLLAISFACINFIVCLVHLSLYLFSVSSEVYEILILFVFQILYYVSLFRSLSSWLIFQHWTNVLKVNSRGFFLGISLWMLQIPAIHCKSLESRPRIQIDPRHISKYFWGFVCVLVARTDLCLFILIQISLLLFSKQNNIENSMSDSNIVRTKATFRPPSFSPGTHCIQLQSLLKANLLHSWEVGSWTVKSYLQETCLTTVPSKGGEKALSWLPWV